ncbi:hypothetical protein ACSBR1_036206 [Camellia fascicularis]
MTDDVSHDDAPSEVPSILPPLAEVEEPAVAGADEEAEDIAADFKMHAMALGGMLWFDDFVSGVLEDVLLREPDSHISYSATEEDSRSWRGYETVTAREWYHKFPTRVRELVNEAGFGLFYTGLSRHMASRALLGALVERWWDTTNSFHFSSTVEMSMTPYDFSMITGLGVEGIQSPLTWIWANERQPRSTCSE